MSEPKYCMVCLTTDVKFCVKDYSFNDIYSALTQIKVNNLNQHLCFECAGLLRKYQQFKLKCICTNTLLSQTIVKTKLTKFYLQTLQNKFKLASNLVYSEIITEDIVDINTIGTVVPEFNTISNIADIVVKESVHTNKNINFDETHDGNDSNGFVFLQNDYQKPSSNMEVFTHTVVEPDHNTIESEEESNYVEIFIEPDSDNVICEQDSEGIITSNTFDETPNNENIKEQVIVPRSETITLSSDDESYHSDSSWTNILNTINKIKSSNKELTLNNDEESSIGTVNRMLQLEVEYISDDHKDINEINSEQMMVDSRTVLNSKTTEKQTERKCQIPTSKIAGNTEWRRPKKAMKQCDKRRKLKVSRETLKNSVIKTLKKHGTVEVLTQEQARDEVLARANCDTPLKCDICFKGFSMKHSLENHIYHHSPKKGDYECDYCHLRYSNKNTISNHMLKSHVYKFTCHHEGCSFKCNLLRQGVTHINFHAGITYKCKYCKLQFKFKRTLLTHINKEHTGDFESEFVCEFCGRHFYNVIGWKLHKFRSHANDTNEYQGPECKECNVHFVSEQAWKLHLVLSRKHKVENGCTVCGETFDNEPDLKSHMEQHQDKILKKPRQPRQPNSDNKRPSYVCQICKAVSKSEYHFKRHQHFAHGQPKPVASWLKKRHICEICGEKFHAPCLLTSHQYLHTGERPHKCQYCELTFRHMAMLRAHENTHTRAQIYKCPKCNKEFLRYTSQYNHTRQCTGKFYHKCLECEQSFINQSTLKAHVRHKHEKVPYPPRKNPRYKRPKRKINLESVPEENIETTVIS